MASDIYGNNFLGDIRKTHVMGFSLFAGSIERVNAAFYANTGQPEGALRTGGNIWNSPPEETSG